MPTASEVLDQLAACGSEQTRKTYTRHGIKSEMYGVKFGDLNTLKKKIKTDHPLALELWASGNHDARIFALMIADPKQADAALLDAWIKDVDNYTLADALGAFVAKTPLAAPKMAEWIEQCDHEWVSATGWNVLGFLASKEGSLPDNFFAPYVPRIQAELHQAKNRARHSMYMTLIAIGIRSAQLRPQIYSAAEHIGDPAVDHGQTGCVTPAAIPYIEKAVARQKH